jgi:hypothetical protein
VTLVCHSASLLKGFDRDIAPHLAVEISKGGVSVHLTTDVTSIDKRDNALRAALSDGTSVEVDCAMYASWPEWSPPSAMARRGCQWDSECSASRTGLAPAP